MTTQDGHTTEAPWDHPALRRLGAAIAAAVAAVPGVLRVGRVPEPSVLEAPGDATPSPCPAEENSQPPEVPAAVVAHGSSITTTGLPASEASGPAAANSAGEAVAGEAVAGEAVAGEAMAGEAVEAPPVPQRPPGEVADGVRLFRAAGSICAELHISAGLTPLPDLARRVRAAAAAASSGLLAPGCIDILVVDITATGKSTEIPRPRRRTPPSRGRNGHVRKH